MNFQRKKIAIYLMTALHIAVVTFIMQVFVLLLDFINASAHFKWDFFYLGWIFSIVLFLGIVFKFHRIKPETEEMITSMFYGLLISSVIWMAMITWLMFAKGIEILEPTLYPYFVFGYFDEWLSQLFNINYFVPPTVQSGTAFVVFAFIYQLFYAMFPIAFTLIARHRIQRRSHMLLSR